MASKSQQELEQPAKVYQLEAVISSIEDMRRDFNGQLRTIINQTAGIVSQIQLKDSEKKVNSRIDNEVKDINIRIDNEIVCVKKETRKVFWVVFACVITLFGNLVMGVLNIK